MKSIHNGKRSRILSGAVCIGLLTALVFACLPALPQATITTSAASLEEKEKELEKAEEERKNLEKDLQKLKDQKKKLQGLKADLNTYITELDATLAELAEQLAQLADQITEKEEQIRETQEELEQAKQTEEEQYHGMTVRMRLMYEQSNKQWITILLESSSLREFLNRTDYMERVVAYDRQLWEDYKATREYVELCEKQLETEKALLDETQAAAKQQQSDMEELMDQKKAEVEAYNARIADSEESIADYEKSLREQEAEIDQLLKEIEEAKNDHIYDGGLFCLPLAKYTRISDDYGWRWHPILQKNQFHNGVDFASPSGTAIYAAYSGKVVAAGYSASMGNYVMVDHGSGLITIYMHASKLLVSSGTEVAKGDTIAKVGSTGRSTGPHLHFGVRLNGEYVSPWNYLSK